MKYKFILFNDRWVPIVRQEYVDDDAVEVTICDIHNNNAEFKLHMQFEEYDKLKEWECGTMEYDMTWGSK